MLSRFKRTHNGVTYVGVRDDVNKVTGSITKGDKKWTIAGYPKINRTLGSYKHGDEVQITIWNKAGTTHEKDRVRFELDGSLKKHSWDTVEVFFAPGQLEEMMYEFNKYMEELNEVSKTNC
jgi:hypothetical protein